MLHRGRFALMTSSDQSGGDLTVTITEADGTVRSQTMAFSSLPVMQRPGALKYEFTTGRYDGGITQGSREATFALGTFIYGLPYDVTLYGGGLMVPTGMLAIFIRFPGIGLTDSLVMIVSPTFMSL